MPIGTLVVSAFNNSEGRPAPDVQITVRRANNGEVISQGVTDSDGKLSPVLLSTPPEVLSTTPPETVSDPESEISPDTEGTSQTSALPFGAYDITAQNTDGDITRIDNVQVYEDTTSLQNIIFPGQSNDINIPNPAIMGGMPEKIPESETKKLPDAGGTVVLARPVVPSLIVVHAGVPSDSSAPNYTVSFTDYIKNVASSEIFATWPREAIKANVIAIVSFTLNRVYTEWYRGKGYDFTVTNSTAYDQAFTYGRNFFSEISDVVDEVFTMYITRESISQPLLAQYSDGINVVRDGWLSQWGSKELADQGYSAQRILQTYYGRDIVIRQAESVEGIPLSFPGVLSVGSSGSNVRALQNQLNAISDNYPLIPKLAVDGIYGQNTEEAVRFFQQIFNLPVTGTVNFPTWYRISDIYVAVRNLAEL